ncbi:hypothetical protein PUN28_020048 [Cardiocondyla obscurior]|uniref:Fanconi-associated nuclease n=3 Tax=Cardiocondyla obscurior TaxID=286306 RepID=A0AAW2E8Z0_9HYME
MKIYFNTMRQTTMDQFYNVVGGSNKSERIKNKKKKSPIIMRTPVKKTRRDFLHKSPNLCKTNKKEIDVITLDDKLPSIETNTHNSPTKIVENRIVTSPIIKYASPIRSAQPTPLSSDGQFTPKTSSPIKAALNRSPSTKRVRRKLIKNTIEDLTSKAINYLNLAKEGAIANNDIDLEKVYSIGKFNYQPKCIDTTITTKYEFDDVVIPEDMYSLHLFKAIVTVFSNPINCGYFDNTELDMIFSFLTLSRHAQALLIRMLKRQYKWHRINHIEYNEISNNLKPVFDELVSRSIFKADKDKEDTAVLINLLQAPEVHKLCRDFKIEKNKSKLVEFGCKTKPLFPGTASPRDKLRTSVNNCLGDCVILNIKVKEVIDRIITLLIPNQDPDETLSDTFLTFLRIEKGEIKFPKITINDCPIFASKKHLLDYIEAKNVLHNILRAIQNKQWENAQRLGTLAAQRLQLILEIESISLQDSSLPYHIRRFMPGYMWLKVLSKSINVFKKTKETLPLAIDYLQILINQNCHMKYRKGQWYIELIKIHMYHQKNLEASVALISKTIKYENLTEVDRLDLLERAEIIVKRKTGISKNSQALVKHMLDSHVISRTQLIPENSITIQGTICGNTPQGKSSWCISTDADEKMYGSVETLALYSYKSKGYIKGVHCEGAFPITLFAVMFWDELYNINIPGAWVSLYQNAPLDLYSSEFYENRKEQIDKKLQNLQKFDSEKLSKYLKDKFELYCEYQSISQDNIFNDSDCIQQIARCLGVEGVIGICKRLIYNFPLWTAGFPDLIVWNAQTNKYKIVEVKGPNDSLSTKQKLWLDYLNRLGLNTEVCYCESHTSHPRGRKRKHDKSEL